MKKFDWNKFKSSRIAVHCKTEEESENFCKLMVENNIPIADYYYWEGYKEDTCYNYDEDLDYDAGYFPIKYYEVNNYTILEWSDYMNDMPELKLGMIVENEKQDRFLVLNYDISTDTATLINSQNTISMHESFVKSDTIYKVYNELLINKDKQLIWERKQQLYNAKIVCIDDKGYSCILKGRTYEVKDGKLIFKDGSKTVNTFYSLEEINNYYSNVSQFIELVD